MRLVALINHLTDGYFADLFTTYIIALSSNSQSLTCASSRRRHASWVLQINSITDPNDWVFFESVDDKLGHLNNITSFMTRPDQSFIIWRVMRRGVKRENVKITSLNSGELFRKPRVHSRADFTTAPSPTLHSQWGESSSPQRNFTNERSSYSFCLSQPGKCNPELRVSSRLLNLCERCALCSYPWTTHTYLYYRGAYFKNSTTPSWRFCNNILEYLWSSENPPFPAGLTSITSWIIHSQRIYVF